MSPGRCFYIVVLKYPRPPSSRTVTQSAESCYHQPPHHYPASETSFSSLLMKVSFPLLLMFGLSPSLKQNRPSLVLVRWKVEWWRGFRPFPGISAHVRILMLSEHGKFWVFWSGTIQRTSFIALDEAHGAPIFCELKSWQRAAGPSPIVPEFFFADLFVPSSILLPRLEIPHMLSSKECSSCWPESSPGNEEQLCICGFFSLVASSLTAVRQTVLPPELFTHIIQLESNHFHVTSSREPLLTSTGSLVPDL